MRHVVAPRANKSVNPALKRRVIGLCSKVVENEKVQQFTRASALRAIASLDEKTGVRLAKKQAKSKDQYLKGAAEQILNPKPRGRKRGPRANRKGQ